jgi:hypothetical protein
VEETSYYYLYNIGDWENYMENENYVPFKERAKSVYEKRLEEVLKQYSVVKVADVNGAHHGVDYEEMKQLILDTFFRITDE